jgi:hypothetical protein
MGMPDPPRRNHAPPFGNNPVTGHASGRSAALWDEQYRKLDGVISCGDPWKDERLRTSGREGQDSSRLAARRQREGGPNLGQPAAPLTALRSNVPFPSRLTGFRYSPCTCSLRENTRDQWRVTSPAVMRILASMGIFPLDKPSSDLRAISNAYLTE